MTTVQKSVAIIARKSTNPGLRRGFLAEAFDGVGNSVQVRLSRGSSSAVKAAIAAGSFGTEQVFPVGTPVFILQHKGKLEVVSLGSKLGAQSITTDMFPAEGLDASSDDNPVIQPGTLPGESVEVGGIGSTQISDGAIKTPHIDVNAIIASHIQSGQINADHINGKVIGAGQLAADIVLIGTILRTGTSGRRVEMDSAGIRNYAADETLLVNIPTNGDPVSVKGDVVASTFISTNGAEMRTTTQFAAGSIAQLGNGVANPIAPATLTSVLNYLGLATPAYPGHGVVYDSTGGVAGSTPSYWVGADPTATGSTDVAYEYDAVTGTLIRTIRKTGSTTTVTKTLGATTHVYDSIQAWSGTGYNSQIATPLVMPEAGTITNVSGYLAGYGADCTARMCLWNSSGTILRYSAEFTAAYQSLAVGHTTKYNKALTSGYAATAGQTIWAGFARPSGSFQYDQDAGGGTQKRGQASADTASMSGIVSDSTSKPNIYITYTVTVDASLEGTMGKIVGVARQGTNIWVLDANGVLFQYNQADLTYLNQFNLSAYIAGTAANAGLFWDGTNLVITTATGTTGTDQVRLIKVTTAGAYSSTVSTTGQAVNGSTDVIRGGVWNASTYYVAITGSINGVYSFVDSTGANIANSEFGLSTEIKSGVTWDGTYFRGYASATSYRVHQFTSWTWTTESPIYWVGYTWYDSVGTIHETAIGAVASVTLGRRRQLQVNTPAIPTGAGEDPDKVRVYMTRNATLPAATNYKLQVTDGTTTRTFTTFATGGAADPAANGFPAGTPAEFKSAAAGWSLKGDGTITTSQAISGKSPVVNVYTATGVNTWTKPTPISPLYITIEGVGGGGAGGAASTDATIGAGGGAGGYFRKLVPASVLVNVTTLTCTVGTAGAGGGGAGGDGADTTVALGTGAGPFSTLTGAKGTGGALNGGATATSGTATNGDLNITGGAAGAGGANTTSANGAGGGTPLGQGGAGRPPGASGGGGTGYGSGGSGGHRSVTTTRNGGNGAQGIIIVTEFYGP